MQKMHNLPRPPGGRAGPRSKHGRALDRAPGIVPGRPGPRALDLVPGGRDLARPVAYLVRA
jgi:hypothetical protein